MSPSELAHIFIDGEPIDPRAEGTLFDALASSGEFRAELRDLLAIRSAVQADVNALMPSKEVTDRLFASLGIAPIGSASASVPASGRSWLRRLWLPLLAALVGSAITAVVVTNNRAHDSVSPVTSSNPSVAQQAPSNAPSPNSETAQSGGGVSSSTGTQVAPITKTHSAHRVHDKNANTAGFETQEYEAYKARVASALTAIPNQQSQPTTTAPETANIGHVDVARQQSMDAQHVTPSPVVEQRLPVATKEAIVASAPVIQRSAPEAASRASSTQEPISTRNTGQPGDAAQQSATQSTTAANAAVPPSARGVAESHVPTSTAPTNSTPAAAGPRDSIVATQSSAVPAESIHGGPLASGLPITSALVMPPEYAAIVRGLISRSVPSSTIATSTGGLPSNVSAGLFKMFSAHHQAGIEIGEESFGQQFSRQEADSFVVYKQNPTLFWGTAAYRLIASPISMFGGMMPYAQTNLGASRIGPLARITLGLMFDIADKLDLIFGGEGAMMWYRFESAWLSTRKIGATFGAAFKF